MENKEYIIAMPYFSNGGGVNFPDTKGKCPCFPASYYKGMSGIGARPFVMEIEKHIIKPYTMNGGGYRYIGQGKVPTICTMYHNVFSTFPEKPYIMEIDKTEICVAMRGRNPDNPSDRTAGTHLEQRLEMNTQGETNCLTTVSKDNLVMRCLTPRRTEYGKQIRKQYEAGEISEQRKNIQQLEPRKDGKTNTLTTVQKDNMIMEKNVRIRRLTPKECARLQSIPGWYEWKGKFPDGKVKDTSDTQIYRLCGNGWNVEVIKHIFSFIDLESYEQVRKADNKEE